MSQLPAKLVRMANQIANEFEHQQGATAVAATWDHIWHFWDPGMRSAIVALEAGGGSGLTEIAAAAVRRLATGQKPESQTRATEFEIAKDGNTEGDAG
ncbi:formate dehydrogenase subunit delta [Sphingomonas sp. GB1N7]|uniref:formate dehydrogenase subunit delta n=1 Tax=Parasphingomonas caseinilytica TaxID=3096158 RepID=UPI002FC5C7FC